MKTAFPMKKSPQYFPGEGLQGLHFATLFFFFPYLAWEKKSTNKLKAYFTWLFMQHEAWLSL